MTRKRPPLAKRFEIAREHGCFEGYNASVKREVILAGQNPQLTARQAKKVGSDKAWDEWFPEDVPKPMAKKKDVKKKAVVGNAEAIDWVFNNVAVKDLTMADAPSAGAYGLYTWAQDTPQNLSSFYATIWKARIPTRQQVETANSLQDDPREESDLIDTLLKAKYGKEQDETLEHLEEVESGRSQTEQPVGSGA